MATDLQAQIRRLIEAWDQPKRRDTMLPYLGSNTCGEVADLVSAQADRLDALSARIQELEGALEPFVFGDSTIADILWGELPDDATMNMTMQLRHYRAARSALGRDADG